MSGIDALLKNQMAKVAAGKTESNALNLNPEFDEDKPTIDSGKQRSKKDAEDQWEEGPTGQAGLGFAGKFTVKSKEEAEKSKRKAQQAGPVESTWDEEMRATVLTAEAKNEGQPEKPKKTGAGVLSAAQGKKGGAIMRPMQQMGEVYFPALGEEPPARREEPVEVPKSTGWDDVPQPATDADGKPRFVNKKKVGGGPIDTITPMEDIKPAETKPDEFSGPTKFTNTKTGGNFKPLEQNKAREEKEKAIEAELAAKREQAIAQRKKDEEARTAALLNRDEKKTETTTTATEEPKEEERWRPAFKSSKAVNNNVTSELASEKYDKEKADRDKAKAEKEKEKTERTEKGDKHDKPKKGDKKEITKPAPKVEAPAEEEKPKVEKPNALGKFVPHEQHGVAHLAGWE